METNSNTVEPLKKISLNYTAGTTPDLKDLIDVPETLEFIFGIGTEGLTQFECALDGKQAGEQGFIEVDKKDFVEIFGHIIPCAQPFPVSASHFFFHYNIANISDPSPREVVKSMAAGGGGGCGDGCDCGCGGAH
jgi:hypothetical protein